jgi:serine/threonine protein kinase
MEHGRRASGLGTRILAVELKTMGKVGIKKFIEGLQKSGLVPLEELRRLLSEIREEHGGPLSDPDQVAEVLVARSLLTDWQCQKLKSGRCRGFFLGDYKLLGHLGTGGMSTVYLAEHVTDGRKRAIKVLPRKRVGKRSYLERFRLEAEATAKLNHPNIVRAFGIGQDNDTYFIVMELIEGENISRLVREHGPIELIDIVRYTAQVARALKYAHEQGIIHRDIKPGNILVNKNGEAKLLDLGLAMSREQEASITQLYDEKVIGTADYLSPEQAINSHQVDLRTDIYSLGCTLYFMLTGHPPFPVGSLAQRIAMHQSRRPADVMKRRPDCPEEIKAICDKMMEKKAANRYEDCQEVFEVLSRWLASQGATVTGSMYATLAVPSGNAVATEGSLTESESKSGVLNQEAEALARSLDEAQEPLEREAVADEELVFLPTVDVGEAPSAVELVDLTDVSLPFEDSSVLQNRRSRQSTSRQNSGLRLWIGIFGIFLLLLLILVIVIAMSI